MTIDARAAALVDVKAVDTITVISDIADTVEAALDVITSCLVMTVITRDAFVNVLTDDTIAVVATVARTIETSR